MDSFGRFNANAYSTDDSERILTRIGSGGWDKTAYGGVPMYVDGKHEGRYVYEFKIKKVSANMCVGIDQGRDSTDKRLYDAKHPHYLLLYYREFWSQGIWNCVEVYW